MVYQKLRRGRESVCRSQPDRAAGMSARWNLGDKESVGARGNVQRMTNVECRLTNDERSPNWQIVGRLCQTLWRFTETPTIIRISSLLRHWNIRHSSFASEMKHKPIAREFGHLLQGIRLLKQMCCAGNDHQLRFATHLVTRHFI